MSNCCHLSSLKKWVYELNLSENYLLLSVPYLTTQNVKYPIFGLNAWIQNFKSLSSWTDFQWLGAWSDNSQASGQQTATERQHNHQKTVLVNRNSTLSCQLHILYTGLPQVSIWPVLLLTCVVLWWHSLWAACTWRAWIASSPLCRDHQQEPGNNMKHERVNINH